ncbi:MAG: hypothetical protein ACK5V5_16620 [Cyclobacteriaceae bacterium]|nr:hypothetical protein [Flammeovirgaceae bacterium]
MNRLFCLSPAMKAPMGGLMGAADTPTCRWGSLLFFDWQAAATSKAAQAMVRKVMSMLFHDKDRRWKSSAVKGA